MILCENLNYIYNPGTSTALHALKDINLHIAPKELVLLEGVSGSGKSTLLSLFGALLKPTSGRLVVEGKEIAKLPDFHASRFRAETIGFIFQAFNLFEALSVEENVTIPLIPLGYTSRKIADKTSRAMDLAKITHKREATARTLSGGEKQRCAIARALVNDPKLILCDEPTANLDRENSLAFIETIRRLHTLDKTIVIATHDPIFHEAFPDARIIHVENGEIR
ncbi:MAG: ABC transporter ATP-binding protein [Campylobacteraceae bacterium 4484_4]|nr:MAG: ABC transporter ATP-binding protein [Campylobacteraceae bacterium 4484_4]